MKIEERPFAVDRTQGTDRDTVWPHGHGLPSETGRRGTRDDHREPQHATEERPRRPRDRVDVSDNVAIFSAALEAARQAPAVRAEVVNEMREWLATGAGGRDLTRLANSLIDSVETLSTRTLRSRRCAPCGKVPFEP